MRKYPLLLLALILAFTVPAVLAVAALDAPLKADANIGRSWYDAK